MRLKRKVDIVSKNPEEGCSVRATLNRVLSQEILKDPRLHRTTKLVYLGMRAHQKTTIKGYAALLGLPYSTVLRAVKELNSFGWVYYFRRAGEKSKIWVPWMPLPLERHLAVEAEKLVDMAPYRGEKLLKIVLDIIVDDDDFVDNARPDWTALGPGDISVEFDRFYREHLVAIEFHGRQHYQEVVFATGKSDLQKQLQLDGRKALACLRQGVTLVEIADIELSYEKIAMKLEGLLPLIPPLVDRPLFRTVANMCRNHVNWVVERHATV